MSTAERLIESTRELLWERGYTGTSPRAIQQRAGAGQGSMYHHFSGKPELALAAMRRSAEQLRADAEAWLGGPGGAAERITRYLLSEREVLRGCPVGRMAQDPEVVGDPGMSETVDGAFRWLRGRLEEVLEEGRRGGDFPAGLDASGTAAVIAAVLQGGYVLARAAGSAEPFERAVGGVLDLLGIPSAAVAA